ncbi:MAG TPA: hypothetical protein VK934_09505, partial [Fimbriimonas sp.]|nr:hypothetical protein [Fimbriimonas sp.]
VALCAVMTLAGPMIVGCGSGASDTRTGANMPPIDDSYSQRAQSFPAQQPKTGMSTGTKVAILAGAAALYYMYKKNKEKRAANVNSEPQYYLSKNGRIYYRDASGQAHWVTPPQQGIQVPFDEAQQYRDFQGYNWNTSGRTLESLYSGGGY